MIRAVSTPVDLIRDPFMLPRRLEGQPLTWRDDWKPMAGWLCVRSGTEQGCDDLTRCDVCGEQRYSRPGLVDHTEPAHTSGSRDTHGNSVVRREPERTWPVVAVLAVRCGCGLSFDVDAPHVTACRLYPWAAQPTTEATT